MPFVLSSWESNSCGYHGDDGQLYVDQGKGQAFGPKFTSGDIIGVGINYLSQEFFDWLLQPSRAFFPPWLNIGLSIYLYGTLP